MKKVIFIFIAIMLLFSLSLDAYAQSPKPGGVLRIITRFAPRVFGYPPDIIGISSMYAKCTLESLVAASAVPRSFEPLRAARLGRFSVLAGGYQRKAIFSFCRFLGQTLDFSLGSCLY